MWIRIFLLNMTQFNQITELWIFVPCSYHVEPRKPLSYLKYLIPSSIRLVLLTALQDPYVGHPTKRACRPVSSRKSCLALLLLFLIWSSHFYLHLCLLLAPVQSSPSATVACPVPACPPIDPPHTISCSFNLACCLSHLISAKTQHTRFMVLAATWHPAKHASVTCRLWRQSYPLPKIMPIGKLWESRVLSADECWIRNKKRSWQRKRCAEYLFVFVGVS